MNEDLFSNIVSISGPLLGAIIGALIATITATRVERRRFQYERKEKLLILQREALSAALDWIDPMRNAEIRASSLVLAAIRGDVDQKQFMKDFPYLLGELVKRDLTTDQKAIMPSEFYQRGNKIVREFDNLKYLGIRYGEEAMVQKKPMAGFTEISELLDIIGKQILELESDLGNAFKATFK